MNKRILYFLLEAIITIVHTLAFGVGIILIKTLKNL